MPPSGIVFGNHPLRHAMMENNGEGGPNPSSASREAQASEARSCPN
jgi:hypothetical protein